MKAYRAGKPVPKPGIQEERCGNRMPHTCRDGSRRNSIPDGSPIPSCSRAGNNDACSGRKDSRSPYNRKFVFPLLCGSADRGTVTGKCQMLRMDQSSVDGLIQKLVFVKLENKKKGIFRFQVPTFQQRKKFGSYTGRITRGLITFLCPFRRLHFRETVFGRKIIPVILPDTGKEIIKGSDTGSISKSETTKDCIKGSFPEHAAHQLVMEVTFSFKASR